MKRYMVYGNIAVPVYAEDEDEAMDKVAEWIDDIYDCHHVADSIELTGAERDYDGDFDKELLS